MIHTVLNSIQRHSVTRSKTDSDAWRSQGGRNVGVGIPTPHLRIPRTVQPVRVTVHKFHSQELANLFQKHLPESPPTTASTWRECTVKPQAARLQYALCTAQLVTSHVSDKGARPPYRGSNVRILVNLKV